MLCVDTYFTNRKCVSFLAHLPEVSRDLYQRTGSDQGPLPENRECVSLPCLVT